jgi:hypothetical protein
MDRWVVLASKGSPSLSPYIPQLLLAQLWSNMLIMVRPFLRHFLIFENYTISKASFSNFENDTISNPPFLCHFLFLNLTPFPFTDAVIFYFWNEVSNLPFLSHFLFLNLTPFPIADAVIFYFWKWSMQYVEDLWLWLKITWSYWNMFITSKKKITFQVISYQQDLN